MKTPQVPAMPGMTPLGLRQRCAWFALCENVAVKTEPHSVLGDVPICQRCADKLERLRG